MVQKMFKIRRVLAFWCIFAICLYFAFQRGLNKTVTEAVQRIVDYRIVNSEMDALSLAEKLNCKDILLERRILQYGSYWLIQNFVRGNISRNIGCAESITYATNGDYTFFWALPTVVERWRAPISFAVYAPGYDLNNTMESIQYVRNCLPESDLIQQFVTFHVYFPAEHMPPYVPLSEGESLNWTYDCKIIPYRKEKTQNLYRNALNMTYPINVGRNIARKAANTFFIFTCDIELFPSPGIKDNFLRMVKRNESLVVNDPGKQQKPRVFVLNVYELHTNVSLPNNKNELKEMLAKKQAVGFHIKKCVNCHKLPYEAEWLNSTGVSEMSVIGIAKRLGKHKVWEPFYISDNKEPMFDERVTWEGQSNKRIQGYSMCLLDYDYNILNDGFLVHSPGIKKFHRADPRNKHIAPMNRFIRSVIVKEYEKLYGKSDYGCGV